MASAAIDALTIGFQDSLNPDMTGTRAYDVPVSAAGQLPDGSYVLTGQLAGQGSSIVALGLTGGIDVNWTGRPDRHADSGAVNRYAVRIGRPPVVKHWPGPAIQGWHLSIPPLVTA